MTSPKHFVLDTNVLLHNPESITSFDDNCVVLPMTVIEELDSFKRHNDELGRSARQVIRKLDSLRANGSLKAGVPMENGGTLKITVESEDMPGTFMDMNVPDNYYKDNDPSKPVVVRWKGHANLFFANWLNFIYQETPYDLDKLAEMKW